MKTAVYSAVLSAVLMIVPLSAAVIRVPADKSTIQAGIDIVSVGDTVMVASGTYVENIDFRGKAISVIGEGGAAATTLSPANLLTYTVRISGVDFGTAVLKGFTIRDGRYSSTVLVYRSGATIEGNIFRDNIRPTYPNVEVISCHYTPALISHNVFYGNGGIACIGLRNGTGDAVVINNTFDRNNRGIYSVALGGTAINNIISNSTEYGVAVTDPLYRFDLFDNNDLYNNHPNYSHYAVPGPGDLSIDPAFCDPAGGDYELLENSPCIDAGRDEPGSEDPDGTVADMGAFYFHQEPSCCNGKRGNVDGDENDLITLGDMHYLIHYLFKDGPEPPCLEEADANGDGVLDASDLSYLARSMFSRGYPDPVADCP